MSPGNDRGRPGQGGPDVEQDDANTVARRRAEALATWCEIIGFLDMTQLLLNLDDIGRLPDEMLAAIQRNHLPGESGL